MTLSRLQQRDAAILQLLCALPTHPYDVQRSLAALGYAWSARGAVIRHLKGLRAEGLVTSVWQIQAVGPSPAGLLDH